MLVVVPDVRRGAHDDEEVVRAPVRDRVTLGEHDTVDVDPAAIQHIAVDADRIGTQMLERECPQGAAAQPDAGVVRTCVDRFAGGRARLKRLRQLVGADRLGDVIVHAGREAGFAILGASRSRSWR